MFRYMWYIFEQNPYNIIPIKNNPDNPQPAGIILIIPMKHNLVKGVYNAFVVYSDIFNIYSDIFVIYI